MTLKVKPFSFIFFFFLSFWGFLSFFLYSSVTRVKGEVRVFERRTDTKTIEGGGRVRSEKTRTGAEHSIWTSTSEWTSEAKLSDNTRRGEERSDDTERGVPWVVSVCTRTASTKGRRRYRNTTIRWFVLNKQREDYRQRTTAYTRRSKESRSWVSLGRRIPRGVLDLL